MTALTRYRSEYGTNQTKRLMELCDQAFVQKCLTFIIENNSTESLKDRVPKLIYDPDDETICVDENFGPTFSYLPSEEMIVSDDIILPIYLIGHVGQDFTHLLHTVKGWWFKSWAKNQGFYIRCPAKAKKVTELLFYKFFVKLFRWN
jgi:hypothetical protein